MSLLQKTFQHLPGLNPEIEKQLWSAGIHNWSQLFDQIDSAPIGTADRQLVAHALMLHKNALEDLDWTYLQSSIGLGLAWRAYSEMKDRCVYLDIETNGGNSGADISIIGLYDGQQFTALVQGHDFEEFESLTNEASMFVTFFGAGFDLPMLKKKYPGRLFNKLHLDLCPTLRSLGYKGGLKKIEVQLGLEREDQVQGLSGYDAVKLWARYKNLGDETALSTLIEYNKADVVNLQFLAELAVKQLEGFLPKAAFDDEVPTLFR